MQDELRLHRRGAVRGSRVPSQRRGDRRQRRKQQVQQHESPFRVNQNRGCGGAERGEGQELLHRALRRGNAESAAVVGPSRAVRARSPVPGAGVRDVV